MRLLLDTTRATYQVSRPVMEKTDQNGAQKFTRGNEPMWTVQVVAMSLDESGAEVLNVTVAGVPPKLTPGQMVTPVDLEVIPWSQGERSGVVFRAKELVPAGGSAKSAA